MKNPEEPKNIRDAQKSSKSRNRSIHKEHFSLTDLSDQVFVPLTLGRFKGASHGMRLPQFLDLVVIPGHFPSDERHGDHPGRKELIHKLLGVEFVP